MDSIIEGCFSILADMTWLKKDPWPSCEPHNGSLLNDIYCCSFYYGTSGEHISLIFCAIGDGKIIWNKKLLDFSFSILQLPISIVDRLLLTIKMDILFCFHAPNHYTWRLLYTILYIIICVFVGYIIGPLVSVGF